MVCNPRGLGAAIFLWLLAPVWVCSADDASTDASDSQTSAAQTEAVAVLEALKERDSKFDNLAFQYEKHRTEVTDLSAKLLKEFKRRMKTKQTSGQEESAQFRARMARMSHLPPPFPVKYSCTEKLTVRGGIAAFERTPETRFVENSSPELLDDLDAIIGIANTSERWSNAGGVLQSSIQSGQGKFIARATNEGSLVTIDQQRMAIEFALGFGFGKRISSLDSVETAPDGGLIAVGQITVWVDEQSRCRLEIDRDRVVRRATIQSDVEGNQHEFETTALGKVEVAGLPIVPETGTFRKKWLGTMREGKMTGQPAVKDDLTIQLMDVEYPVADAEFARMTDFTVDENTTVRDVTKDRTVQSAMAPLAEAVSNPFRNWLVVINLVFVVVLASTLFYQRRARS